MFTLLTTDFCFEGPAKSIEYSEVIQLLKHVSVTLTNLTYEFIFCHQLFKNFNALEIVKELLHKFFMTDYLKIETFVQQRQTGQIKEVIGLLDDIVFMVNNLVSHWVSMEC